MERDPDHDHTNQVNESDAGDASPNDGPRIVDDQLSGSSSGSSNSDGSHSDESDSSSAPPSSVLSGRVEENQEEQAEVGEVEDVPDFEAALTQAFSESYSGALPHPDHWHKYGQDTQERMLRMAEAWTTDESGRRDRVINAEISEAPKGRRMAFVIAMSCLIGAAVSAWVFQNHTATVAFVALPVMSVIRDFIKGKSNNSENSKE